MLLSHFKFSFKEDKLNFRFIGTLNKIQYSQTSTVQNILRIKLACTQPVWPERIMATDSISTSQRIIFRSQEAEAYSTCIIQKNKTV